ncbi:MAG: hypothetical protein AB9907_18740 [Flexilinea sp.]
MEIVKNVIYKILKPLLIFISLLVTIWVVFISFPFLKDTEFTKSFASNTLSTIIGAVCGLIIVFWVNDLEREKSKKDSESQTQSTKEKVLQVLVEDLKHNQTELNKQLSPQESEAFLLRINLKIESWRAFSNGGELQSINDPEILHNLANIFDMTSSVIYLLELLTDFGSGRGSYKAINNQAVPNQLKELIPKLLAEIDSFIDIDNKREIK